MHLNPISSRRELYGNVVVHGIHAVVWMLEVFFGAQKSNRDNLIDIVSLDVQFLSPIYLNKVVNIRLISSEGNNVHLQLLQAEQVLVELYFSFCSRLAVRKVKICSNICENKNPMDLTFDQLRNKEGTLELFFEANVAKKKFPVLTQILNLFCFAEILAMTRLVGMHCPGMCSIFSALKFKNYEDKSQDKHLTYKVVKIHDKFKLVKINVENSSLFAEIEAFYRPMPYQQLFFKDVIRHVKSDEFSGKTSLVLGGSRGLGEITAKIFAGGGGKVVITYHKGVEDAKRVRNEIKDAGFDCEYISYDVNRPDDMLDRLAKITSGVDYIFFFATPKIAKSSIFNMDNFKLYNSYYVDGFYKIYKSYRTRYNNDIKIFYPSTVYLDEKALDFGDYISAKYAAEILCEQIQKIDRRIYVLVKRLPRMATDQTQSLTRHFSENAFEFMLKTVRELNALKLV